MKDYNYSERLRCGRVQWGDRFDSSKLDEVSDGIRAAYESGARVRVSSATGAHVRTGRVSTTTGWRPSFLLMHRSNAMGSWDVLGPTDRVVAVWDGRKYREVV